MDDTTPQDLDDGGPDDLDSVADRLEAALERIVQRLDAPKPAAPNPATVELVARLDGLIGRLRDALGRQAARDPASGGAGE